MQEQEPEVLLERIERLETELGRLRDEREIAHVMYRYVHACDELKDADRIASFFAEDAVWEGQGRFGEFGSTIGREAIREMFVDNPTMLPFTAHFLTNPDLGLSPDGDRAWGRWHVLEAATLRNGMPVWMAAWYDNDFVRHEGRWLISHLRYRDRFVCPYDEGWAKTSYVSPRTLQAEGPQGPTPGVGGSVGARLDSILIGSSHADEVRNWYRRAFDASENEMGAVVLGDVQIFVEQHSEVSGPSEEPARVMVNIDVTDIDRLASHLSDMGVIFVRPVEATDFGRIATVEDPDGNYVQVIEWSGT